MQVSDVMTMGAQCVRPSNSLQEAALMMKYLNVEALPVCENDRLVGLLTDRDVVVRAVAEGYDNRANSVQDVMTPEVRCCFEDQDVQEAAQLMRERQVCRLIVLNNDKRLVGIVALGDLAVETGDEKMAGATLEPVSLPR
jgi:CBS domain-containing protein